MDDCDEKLCVWMLTNYYRVPDCETEHLYILYILVCKSHFLYSEIHAKIECVLYAGHTKREGNIWHNLGGNTIILFFNIDNEYINK